MSIVHNQRKTFLRLLAEIRPVLRTEPGIPARIEAMLRREKSFGSRDRRLYRELLYTVLRYLPWVETATEDELVGRVALLAAESQATRPFREAWAGAGDIAGLSKEALLPEWFRTECPEAFVEPMLTSLLSRAPLWLRLQTNDEAAVESEFASLGWTWTRSSELSAAWKMGGDVDVTKTDSYARGAVEIQDIGSQMVLESCGLDFGGHWLDACAGAGGKTLQLAQILGSGAKIDAHDIRLSALEELAFRARRLGAKVNDPQRIAPRARTAPCQRVGESPVADIQLVRSPEGTYDGVLVDAPCTGSGTWRRSPHLKWSSSLDALRRVTGLQTELLERFSTYVRNGGTLVYVTCSLCHKENEAIVKAFLTKHSEFSLCAPRKSFGLEAREGMLTVWPSVHDSDGLFVARMERKG